MTQIFKNLSRCQPQEEHVHTNPIVFVLFVYSMKQAYLDNSKPLDPNFACGSCVPLLVYRQTRTNAIVESQDTSSKGRPQSLLIRFLGSKKLFD